MKHKKFKLIVEDKLTEYVEEENGVHRKSMLTSGKRKPKTYMIDAGEKVFFDHCRYVWSQDGENLYEIQRKYTCIVKEVPQMLIPMLDETKLPRNPKDYEELSLEERNS